MEKFITSIPQKFNQSVITFNLFSNTLNETDLPILAHIDELFQFFCPFNGSV